LDTVTQMLLGATVAQVGFRKRLGRKAMVAGAVLGLVPDLDVAAGWFGGPFANMEHHRGLTHSLLFGPLVGPLFGWLLWRLERWRASGLPEVADRARLRSWIWLAILALFTHPLIDLFTSYGTQLLWPLSNARFAIDAMPIIDPVYSAALLIAVIIGAFARVRPQFASDVAAAALLFITVYSFAGWAINDHVERNAAADFGRPAAISAYPMMFQPYYRRVVAVTPEAAHVGYYSVLNPKGIEWRTYPREMTDDVTAVRKTDEAALFDWFSMGKLLWRSFPDGSGGTIVEATDLRYGMPGNTDHGFWGIRAKVNGAGKLPDGVKMFAIPREVTGPALRRFWSNMTGW
jgi:inner membrane protein